MGATTRAFMVAFLLVPVAACGSQDGASAQRVFSAPGPDKTMTSVAPVNELTTTFAQNLPEDRLNNLTLWLDQTSFPGFGNVDYRFVYTADGTILATVSQRITKARLQKLCSLIDAALARIVHDTTLSTSITRSDAIAPAGAASSRSTSAPSGDAKESEKTLLETTVMTDYGQFDLVWDGGVPFNGEPDMFFEGQVNGLVGAAAPGSIYFILARRSGGSKLTIRSLAGPPPLPDPMWEDVVEVSAELPDGEAVQWQTWAGETSGELLRLLPGPHRVRVSARGRDEAAIEDGEDRYLIEIWSALMRPDAVLRTTSKDARYWHEAYGGRR